MTDTEFIPYGKEWEAEMMKWTKPDLINFLRKACKEKEAFADAAFVAGRSKMSWEQFKKEYMEIHDSP